MKFWVLVISLLILSFCSCPAQTTQTPTTTTPATSTSTQSSGNSATQNRRLDEERRQNDAEVAGAFEALRSLEIPTTEETEPLSVTLGRLQTLYRKPDKKELKNFSPSQLSLTQYEKFLQQPNTGIFKLSADQRCATNIKVIVATENCLSKSMPGGGTAFSFRINGHRMLHLADLVLEKDVIKTDAILQQGIMVNLGNIELEELSPQSNGLKFLYDFKPAANLEELQKATKELGEGIKSDGFIYRFAFYADEKTTFALRSIAFRGNVDRSFNGHSYNEMDYDKRKDVVVVFRIISKEPNGDITILWKELSRQDSPKIELPKEQK